MASAAAVFDQPFSDQPTSAKSKAAYRFNVSELFKENLTFTFDLGRAAAGSTMSGFAAVEPSHAIWSWSTLDPKYLPLGNATIATRTRSIPAPPEVQDASSSESEPRWWPSVLRSIERLLALPPGWDSYGAPRISRDVLTSALQVLCWAAKESTPPPWIVPTGRGGVQLEWHEHQLDIEVYVEPGDPTVGLFVEDHLENTTSELLILADVKALSQALELLASRAAAGEAK